MTPLFYSLTLFASMTVAIISIIYIKTVINNNTNYLIILYIIMWDLFLIICLTQLYGMVSIGFISFFVHIQLFKYKYNEINLQINKSFKYKVNNLLFNAIREHKLTTGIVKKLNDNVCVWIFILYFFCPIILNLLLYFSQTTELLVIQIFVASIAFGEVAIVYLLTYVCANVTKSAHKPLRILHQFMINSDLSYRQRLKIMDFINFLSGPDIGFYCLDFFPMNSFENYSFIIKTLMTYFLIRSLF